MRLSQSSKASNRSSWVLSRRARDVSANAPRMRSFSCVPRCQQRNSSRLQRTSGPDSSSAFAIVMFLRDVACSSSHIGPARRAIYPPAGGHSAVSRGRREGRALGQLASCAVFLPRTMLRTAAFESQVLELRETRIRCSVAVRKCSPPPFPRHRGPCPHCTSPIILGCSQRSRQVVEQKHARPCWISPVAVTR
jgi:hypothetical protein